MIHWEKRGEDNMKKISELDFGYGDAANYLHSRSYKQMFSNIFVRDRKLDKFLHLLYDLNMICYLDAAPNGGGLFRFGYREREILNLEA